MDDSFEIGMDNHDMIRFRCRFGRRDSFSFGWFGCAVGLLHWLSADGAAPLPISHPQRLPCFRKAKAGCVKSLLASPRPWIMISCAFSFWASDALHSWACDRDKWQLSYAMKQQPA
jgi:hypothetical protein